MQTYCRHRATALAVVLVVCDLTILDLARPRASVAHLLAHPQRWVALHGADRAALELARTGLWTIAAWLALGIAVTAASQLPGGLGRLASAVARRTVPAALRKILAGATGAAIALTPIAAGTAWAGAAQAQPRVHAVASARASPATEPQIDWPRTPAPESPAVPWPGTTSEAGAGGTSRSAPADVVVMPGDSLWLIAARRLGPHAIGQQIAATWPRWYRANARTIGPDPGRLLPGQHLHAPGQEREPTVSGPLG